MCIVPTQSTWCSSHKREMMILTRHSVPTRCCSENHHILAICVRGVLDPGRQSLVVVRSRLIKQKLISRAPFPFDQTVFPNTVTLSERERLNFITRTSSVLYVFRIACSAKQRLQHNIIQWSNRNSGSYQFINKVKRYSAHQLNLQKNGIRTRVC